jgi:endoglucanase
MNRHGPAVAVLVSWLAPLGCASRPSQASAGRADGGPGGPPPTAELGDAGTADAADASPASPYPLLPAVPLHTESRWIVDANGRRFKLAGVSWYGAESPDLVPSGLDHNTAQAIAHLAKQLGFNSVRIPWALELYEQNPVIASTLLSLNPSLQGKHALDVLDAVIDAIAREGLVVILDNHRSRGDWCCDTYHGDGLWHSAQYPETNWIADWKGMVERYRSQPAVVGVDLRNEIRGQLPDDAGACTDCDNPPAAGCGCWQPSWGDNNPLTDWPAAAERAANAIQQAGPDLLVIVEGNFWSTWFGASYRPVKLAVPNRLVYSPHNYSSTNGGAASFADYPAFKAAMDAAWGYLVTTGQPFTAPVWVGEFGTNHNSASGEAGALDASASPGAAWWGWIRQYLADKDLDWSVWALNGTQGKGYGRTFGNEETFGVLNADWNAPAPAPYIAALQAIQAATQGP